MISRQTSIFPELKLKRTVDEKDIIHKRLFTATLHNKILSLKNIFTYSQKNIRARLVAFNNVRRLNHSSSVKNIIKKKSNTFSGCPF